MPDDIIEKRSGHTQSVSRALGLLIQLAEEVDGLNLSELARRSDLHRPPHIACLQRYSLTSLSVLKMGAG